MKDNKKGIRKYRNLMHYVSFSGWYYQNYLLSNCLTNSDFFVSKLIYCFNKCELTIPLLKCFGSMVVIFFMLAHVTIYAFKSQSSNSFPVVTLIIDFSFHIIIIQNKSKHIAFIGGPAKGSVFD
jgi:hypothetical protein